MDPLASAAVAQLLTGLGEPGSAAAGGAAAALAASIAAGLLRGLARGAGDWPEAPGAAAQAEALAARLMALATENAAAYSRARDALAGALPHDAQERRDFAMGSAVREAAAPPARIARHACDVAALALVIAEHGSPRDRLDAQVAAVLASAAAAAAAHLVAGNLVEGADGSLLEDARGSAERARAAAAQAAGLA